MTTIAEDYVSFEVAKMLKEKGFDEDIDLWYDENGEMFFKPKYDIKRDWRLRSNQKVYECPTRQMALKWLREKYEIDIIIFRHIRGKRTTFFDRIEKRTHVEHQSKCNLYPSYEDACEAAIKYCLENLI